MARPQIFGYCLMTVSAVLAVTTNYADATVVTKKLMLQLRLTIVASHNARMENVNHPDHPDPFRSKYQPVTHSKSSDGALNPLISNFVNLIFGGCMKTACFMWWNFDQLSS